MNKIYTLKKEILFKNNIYDILSLDIDKDLKINNNKVEGNFKLSGEYLIRESEQDNFNIEIPYYTYIDDMYDSTDSSVDIDDFYYEIKDSNKLVINVDIIVKELSLKEERNDVSLDIDIIDSFNDTTETSKEEKEEKEEKVDKELYVEENNNNNNNFVTYKVYIVKENDTIEQIMEKYSISYDLLEKYNVINELNTGDKLIIPYERD